jgi:thiamine-monophosphate kinase
MNSMPRSPSPPESVRLTEAEIIALFRGPPGADRAAGLPLVVGNGDDAAAWVPPAGQALVITTDVLVEDVHWRWDLVEPEAVGEKLVAVNVSDIAAMGAVPAAVLLSVVVPASEPRDRLQAVAAGIHRACRTYGCAVVGGNVSRTGGPLELTATVTGAAAPDRLLRRGHARPGDDLWVTGDLGSAGAGLAWALAQGAPAPTGACEPYDRWVRPLARVRTGRALAQSGWVTSLCDVSDGLAVDVEQLLAGTGTGARIEAERIPISSATRSVARAVGRVALDLAVGAGEDYELLFTASPEHRDLLPALDSLPLTRIGRVVEGPSCLVVDGTARPLSGGWQHFGDEG